MGTTTRISRASKEVAVSGEQEEIVLGDVMHWNARKPCQLALLVRQTKQTGGNGNELAKSMRIVPFGGRVLLKLVCQQGTVTLC